MKNTELLARTFVIKGLVKQAEDSSGIGRWLAQGALATSQHREAPFGWAAGGAPTQAALAVNPAVGHALNLVGVNEALMNATTGVNEENLKQTGKKVRGGTYSDAAAKGLTSALPVSVISGLAGLAAGHLVDSRASHNTGMGKVVGGITGTATPLLLSILRALYDKKVLSTVSQETLDRAAKTKGKHPFATALPLGDVVGAATG